MGIRKRERHGSRGHTKNRAARRYGGATTETTYEGGRVQSKGTGTDTKRKGESDIPLGPAKSDAKQGGPRERIVTKKWDRYSTISRGRNGKWKNLEPCNEINTRHNTRGAQTQIKMKGIKSHTRAGSKRRRGNE